MQRRNFSRGMGFVLLLALVLASLPWNTTPARAAGIGWSPMHREVWPNQSIYDVWGSSSSDIFAVGGSGLILHYDGTGWLPMDSGTTSNLNGVWGSSGSDVFAVGYSGTILHYDGSSWSEMTTTSSALKAVWGSSGSDVFAVGNNGTILHYDGSSWTEMNSTTTNHFSAVWGSSGSDVFATTTSGNILHYDGSTWVEMTTTSAGLNAVWGSSGSDVFAVGDSGTILRYNGNAWSPMNSGLNTSLITVWGTSANNIFTADTYGTILRYDGSNWRQIHEGGITNMRAMWWNSDSDIVAVGNGNDIWRYNGSSWSQVVENTSTNSINDVWGSSGSDIFAVGDYGTILHYQDTAWTQMRRNTAKYLNGVWGSSGSDVFVVGSEGTILHYNGSSWSLMDNGTTSDLNGVWGTSGSNVFAVGDDGTILHYNGTTWSPMTSPTTYEIHGVWGSSGSDVFAVGNSGTILHYDGTTWSEMAGGPTYTHLYDVWGSSSSDVFAVGGSDTWHYNGSSWSKMETPTYFYPNGVWGSSGTDVFAVGSGDIMHYDGSIWSEMNHGTSSSFNDVWGSGSSDVFAVGGSAVVLHYAPIPDIVLGSPTIETGSVAPGSANNIVYTLHITSTVGDTVFSAMDVTTTGTHYNDIAALKVWYSPDDTFDAASDRLLAQKNNPGSPGTKSFTSFAPQTIAQDTSGYLFVTVDVAEDAEEGKTIGIAAPPLEDLSFTAGVPTGPLTNGGLQIISATGGKPFDSCPNVTEIPQAECEALVALYNATDGTSWSNNEGWLDTTSPCNWYGVTCVGGHVSRLDLADNNLSGQLPTDLTSMTNMRGFDFGGTSVCEPDDTSFQEWLNGISDASYTELCPPPVVMTRTSSSTTAEPGDTVSVSIQLAATKDNVSTTSLVETLPEGFTFGGFVGDDSNFTYSADTHQITYNGPVNASQPISITYSFTIDSNIAPAAACSTSRPVWMVTTSNMQRIPPLLCQKIAPSTPCCSFTMWPTTISSPMVWRC